MNGATGIKEIKDRVGSRRRRSSEMSSFLKLPSQDELKDESFRGKCTQLIHSFKFQVSLNYAPRDLSFYI